MKYSLTAVRCSGKNLPTSQVNLQNLRLKGASTHEHSAKIFTLGVCAITLSLTLANVTAMATCTTDVTDQLCLKSRKLSLDTVSTGSGSDLVIDGSQESSGISHADH